MTDTPKPDPALIAEQHPALQDWAGLLLIAKAPSKWADNPTLPAFLRAAHAALRSSGAQEDAVGTAEREVGRYIYRRIEALMDAKSGTPEEYGEEECAGNPVHVPPPARQAQDELLEPVAKIVADAEHYLSFAPDNFPTGAMLIRKLVNALHAEARRPIPAGWSPSPIGEANHAERLSAEELKLTGAALSEWAWDHLSRGYGVSMTVREVSRLIQSVKAYSPPSAATDQVRAKPFDYEASLARSDGDQSDLIASTETVGWLATYLRPGSAHKIIFRTLDGDYGIGSVDTEDHHGATVVVINSNEPGE